MSRQRHRIARGGLVDRGKRLRFTFDGWSYDGYAGDTLASALLANGVRLVGRGFKYHRPRGIFSAGSEEPSALVAVGEEGKRIPNCRATQVRLYDGLSAVSQNRWPSLRFDAGAIANAASPILPAGFYYKTFMWPRGAWRFYEYFIRKAAGLGQAPDAPSGAVFDSRYAHCDVLIAGGGAAGLSAALAAARSGARVVLADEDGDLGGRLLSERAEIDGQPGLEWVATAVAELENAANVTLLRRTTVFGGYDDAMFGLVERLEEPGVVPSGGPVERLWRLRAKRVVLATGAIERPLVFPNNDRPGVMLAGAAQSYAGRFAVQPGRRAVIFTNNDTAHVVARDLKQAGLEIVAVVDTRPEADAGDVAVEARLPCRFNSAVVNVRGAQRVRSVEVMTLSEGGSGCVGEVEVLECDLLCVSGGWSPTVHLYAQAGGIPRYDDTTACFVPGDPAEGVWVAGAANGRFGLSECLEEGTRAGAEAATELGFGDGGAPLRPPRASDDGASLATIAPMWEVPAPERKFGKRFVDVQNDVSVTDIRLAAREGFESIEHVKRYTTLGMGTDQGKTSNVNGLAILASELRQEVADTGTTTFRPPYTPVSVDALAGRARDDLFDPARRTPMHAWHRRFGAVFMPAGLWHRPQAYPARGESLEAAVQREARAVRASVGMVDVSTLGKIDLQGPDVAEFLNRIYTNGWTRLPVGKGRYGIMLREDGVVLDDGTTTRLGEQHYHMTTTTGGAATVMAHIRFHLEMVWPNLRVHATSVSEQWAAMALAGPNSRRVLARVADVDVSDEALPFMGYVEGRVAGVPARIFRISFSGELGFEINVAAEHGLAVWQAIMNVGAPFGITAYGVDAMDVLRVEKGHLVVGADIDGRVVPSDVGLEGMVSTKKAFIGRRMLERTSFQEADRLQLVGLEATGREGAIPPGAHLVDDPSWQAPGASQGRVTSPAISPARGRPIALALLKGGKRRHGERIFAVSPMTGERVEVRVGSPVFVDPEGARVRT